MRNRCRASAILFGVVAIALTSTPAVADVADILLGDSTVTASTVDGVTTAEVRLINTGSSPYVLPAVAVVPNQSACRPSLIDTKNRTVAPRATTPVSIVFPTGCFSDSTDIVVEIDSDTGPESLPPITVKAPTEKPRPPWKALGPGAALGALMLAYVIYVGHRTRSKTEHELQNPQKVQARRDRYAALQRVVNIRMGDLTGQPVDINGWKTNSNGDPITNRARWIMLTDKGDAQFPLIPEPTLDQNGQSRDPEPPNDVSQRATTNSKGELVDRQGRLIVLADDLEVMYTSTGRIQTFKGLIVVAPKGSRPVMVSRSDPATKNASDFFSGFYATPTLAWKVLVAPSYRYRDEVGNLAAGWSFKDSWVSNLTIGTTAFVALTTSVDAFTAFLGEAPKAALGVMTVAGLVSGVLIALAVTISKLTGPSADKVSVGGLITATALTAGAAGFQTGTVGAATALAFGLPTDWFPPEVGSVPLLSWLSLLLTIVVGGVLAAYVGRSLRQLLARGYLDNVPALPPDALEAWDVAPNSKWQAQYVEQRIRTAFAEWLLDAEKPKTPVGTALPSTSGGGLVPLELDPRPMPKSMP